MNQPNQAPAPAATDTAAPGAGKTGIVLGLLATLFAGGVFLLYGLTLDAPAALGPAAARDAATAVQTTPEATAHAADTLASGQAPATEHAGEPATPSQPAVTAADLAGLQAQLDEARAHIETLTARTEAFAATRARIDALEARVAAAQAAADAAASRADEVARRYADLTADYARLGARFTPEGVLIRLDETALRFTPGAADLPVDADTALADIADFLERHPGQQALLRGHTDATGNDAVNLELSVQRARAVRDALIGLGVAPGRLRAEGVGAAEPVADNASAAGRGSNRRVDVLLAPA